MIRLVATARARLRRRLSGGSGDDGFTLIYTLLVITLVTVLVGSALVVATANVVPAVRSAYVQAADAAARSAIDDFRAKADAACRDAESTVTACKTLIPLSSAGDPESVDGWRAISTVGGYRAEYRWTATPAANWFRLRATGRVGAGSLTVTRTLVADVQGGGSTNLLDYNVVVGYETQAPDVVAAQFPARTISLDAAARSAAKVTGDAVSWSGAAAGTTAGSVNVCNALYGGLAGRSHNPPPGAATPYVDWAETGTSGGATRTALQPCQVSLGHSTTLTAVSAAAAADGRGGYATHDALLLSNSFPGGTGPVLDQRVSTGYRYDPTTATPCDTPNQDYRSFNLACAGYANEIGGAPAPGSGYTPQYDPVLPAVPSTVCSTSSSTCTTPAVPASGACVYDGPTRVRLNGDGTATVTSPQTTAPVAGSPAGCYPAAPATGVFQYTTPVLATMAGFTGVFAVRNHGAAANPPAAAHSPTGWNLTGQKSTSSASAANTVFYRRVDAATAPDAPTAVAGSFTQAGQNPRTWSAYSSTKKCGAVSRQTDTPNGPKPWDEQTFQCDWFGKMGDNTFLPPTAPDDAYTAFQNLLNGHLASATALTVPGNPGNTINATVNGTTTARTVDCSATTSFVPTAASTDQLACLVQHDLRSANTGLNEANWANPAKSGYTHQYVVPAYSQTTSTTTATVGTAPSSGVDDPLFDGTRTGSASTEKVTTTTTTFDVASQVYGCYKYGLVGTLLGAPTGDMDVSGSSCTNLIPTGKWSWGDGYYPDRTSPQFQFTVVRKTYSDFAQGASASAFFPSMRDVTQYATGSAGANGNNGPGDLYVEGTAARTLALVAQNDVIVTGSLAPASSSQAVELVAQANVRVYHPVACTSADAAAVAATTAGFCPNDITGAYTGVPAPADRPDQQYANLRTDLASMTLNAAVFALGGAPSTVTCPQWSGSGTCSGEFSVDNFNRGSGLDRLTVKGTLVMQHHGPVGREWEIADTANQTGRPHSGYQLDLRYQNLRGPLTKDAAIAGVVSTVTTTSSTWHVVSISTGGS